MLRQEDPPDEVPPNLNSDADGEEAAVTREPRMYFIAKGKYDVFVKKNHIVSVNRYSDKSKEKADRSL